MFINMQQILYVQFTLCNQNCIICSYYICVHITNIMDNKNFEFANNFRIFKNISDNENVEDSGMEN